MKFIHAITVIAFMLCFGGKAHAGDPVWMTQAQTQPLPKTLSLLFKHHNKQAIDLCREYKRKIIIGNIMVPAGTCAIAGGVYMIYKGTYSMVSQYSRNWYDYRNQPTSKHDVGFVCGGTALLVAGLAMLPGGAIMASVAKVKHCKYCRAGGAMYFTPSNTGLGLACNF